jgi:hypothetical protein
VATPPSPVAAATEAGPGNDAKGAKGTPPDHEWVLDFTDRRGRKWSGKFKAHALTIRDRMTVGVTRGRLAQGVPLQSLDNGTLEQLEVQAHLAVAIDDAPPWWNAVMDGKDAYAFDVLGAVYEEVAKHERRFWGAEPKAGS